MFADVRRALADPSPVSLLDFVSTPMLVTDPRRHNPFERLDESEPDAVTRDDVTASFIDVRAPETSVLLAVIASSPPGPKSNCRGSDAWFTRVSGRVTAAQDHRCA